ncbi:MAG: hypothetical protein ACYCPP_01590 [Nitrososphaerales archaeon]
MSTSIKVSVEDKRKLDKLQALVTMKTSKKVTQQEVLSELIRGAIAEGDRFVEKVFQGTVPMSDESFRKILSLTSDWKVKTKWEDIDRSVYGETRAVPRTSATKSRNKVKHD